ncbi:YqeG family HAD IIIA-type phosphatase [Petrotoga sp. 9T1HF07.CasAA.8.2]|uniref:YqeG family HAD IIIA-type phosphatase n=1 Tax=Petrotoga sp. 9T1HF07.CasAA.8.2 TaxID=1434329 RepID=UPI000EFD96C1|nr:YqeG family HAD IIIA-type phosphatase [Petrotoga sp. 9T1HF07.CasAA.8.2]
MNRTMGLFKYIPIPREYSPDIYSIDYEKLKKLGFNTILMDYDFTITVWRDDNIPDKTLNLLNKLINDGFKVAIVTNSKREKVKIIEKLTMGKVKVYTSMKKPNTKKLKSVLEELGSKESETVIIGDLFITDISVGNRLGLYTILINPYTYGLENKFKQFMAGFTKFAYNVFFYTIGWFFRAIDLVGPNEFKKSVFDIDYQHLKEKGYKILVFDFDNTLSEWHSDYLQPEVIDLFLKLKDLGFYILIASNSSKKRFMNLDAQLSDLGIDLLASAMKPLRFKIRKKIKFHGYKPGEGVVIGDQLFTDVALGNALGFYTIKVKPLSKKEGLWTRFMRFFERIALKWIRKKPTLVKNE